MNRIHRWTLRSMSLVLVSVPAVAQANEHGDAPKGLTLFNWPSDEDPRVGFAYILLNFVLLMLVLNKLLFKGLVQTNREKSDAIKHELEAATRARAEAEAILAEYEAKVKNLTSEVEQIRSDAEDSAKRDREQILATAKIDAAKMLDAAKAQAERDAARRKHELEAEIVDQALVKAEAAIRKNFSNMDQQRLLTSYVAEVSKTKLDQGYAGGAAS